MTNPQKIKHLEKYIGKVDIMPTTGNVIVKLHPFPKIFSASFASHKTFHSIYAAHKFYFGY